MQLNKSIVVLLLSVLLLTACGGGGGGSSPTPTPVVNNPEPVNSAPVADAGDDQAVDEQTQVTLTVAGSDSDGSIVNAVWTQVSGPEVSLPNIDNGSVISGGTINIIFTAPAVTTSTTLVFRLTVTDDDGATDTDDMVVVVNPVNITPLANAGADQSVTEADSITLSGSGTDPDGDIVAFSWVQVSGPEVTITNSSEAEASFIAPATVSIDTLAFELTVTDNEGASATDSVAIEVLSVNTPDLAITFPPALGGYTETNIDVFGSSEVKNGASVTSVVITTDIGSSNANVSGDGDWRASDVALPEGFAETSITVQLTDSNGLQRSKVVHLTSTSEVGSGWKMKDDVRGISIDPEQKRAYVLTTGNWIHTNRIHRIDLTTGDRIAELSNNSNSELGVALNVPRGMELDKANNRLLINDGGTKAIVAVDLTTGERVIISDENVGTGELFENSLDVALDNANNRIFVVDNHAARIISVDLDSGDRTVIADDVSTDYGINVPIGVAFDKNNDRLVVTENLYGDTPLLTVDLLTSPALTSIVSSDFNSGPKLDQGIFALTLNDDGTIAYVLQRRYGIGLVNSSEILAVDLSTGNRILLTALGFNATDDSQPENDIDYDSVNHLLYVAGGDPFLESDKSLLVIDPQSGDVVKVSQ